jgi:hypothetical protein
MLDNNSYRCLALALTQIELADETKKWLCRYFENEGLLRALLLGY